jgi:hypothetical protein
MSLLCYVWDAWDRVDEGCVNYRVGNVSLEGKCIQCILDSFKTGVALYLGKGVSMKDRVRMVVAVFRPVVCM